MYDANEPKDAPCGYIARTNFSFAGEVNAGAGYVRYQQADKVLMPASAMNVITPRWILDELSRSFANPLLGMDLKSGEFNRSKSTGWFVEQDFIARRSTSCAVIVQGVKPGENPELTTMWTALGFPPASVAIPVWVKGVAGRLPVLLTTDEGLRSSPIAKKAFGLMNQVFSYTQGMGSGRYMNWELLYNNSGTGFMQRLSPVEQEVFLRTEPLLEGWRRKGAPDMEQMYRLYKELDSYVAGQYRALFGI